MKKNRIVTNFFTVVAICIFSYTGVSSYAASSPEAADFYNAGLEYVNKEDYQHAVDFFQKAIQLDPDMTDAYYNLGSIYEYFGDYQTAVKAYNEVILIEPHDYETTLKVAELYMSLGSFNDALYILKDVPSHCDVYDEAQNMIKKIAKIQTDIEQENARNLAAEKAAIKKQASKKVKKNEVTERFTSETSAQNESYYENGGDNYNVAKSMEGRTPNGGYTDPDKSLLNRYSSPTGIAIDDAGNIFVASFADNSIYVVSPDEKNHLFSDSPMLDGPIGIAIDPSGCLFVANYNKDNILRITPDGNVGIYKSNVNKPYSVSVFNNVLYVSEQGSNSVIKYQL